MAVVNIFIVALLLGTAIAGQHDIYSGYSVHAVKIRDFSDIKFLHELETSLDLDQWEHGAPGGLRDATFMVSPQTAATFLEKLDEQGMEHYLKVEDVSKELEEFDRKRALYQMKRGRVGREAVPFDDYPRYAQVDEYIERIAAEYPDLVTLVNAGTSFEGRAIKYLKISTTNFTDSSKPIYFMDAMIHAREWVTTPVALYSIHRLVEDLRDGDRDLLEGTDWIIYPLVNPDGYEYTHTNQRLWRRTRSFNPEVSTTCYGIDANRNFDVAFNTTTGVSPNPCSDIYPGQTPFSEPETGYVRDVLHEHLERIQVYLNIHSHGNWVLFGFGNTSLPDNGVQLHFVGAVMGAAIDAVKLPIASHYVVGNSAMLLYASSGSAQDYAQHIGVPLSYTLELPGLGYFFQVPNDFIGQINEETWTGIGAQARVAKLLYNHRIQSAQNTN